MIYNDAMCPDLHYKTCNNNALRIKLVLVTFYILARKQEENKLCKEIKRGKYWALKVGWPPLLLIFRYSFPNNYTINYYGLMFNRLVSTSVLEVPLNMY